MENSYKYCTLCMRKCGIDRTASVGYCGVKSELRIGRAALHFWEEPSISGTRGSGTIFFSGCSLGCIFCQNREISRGEVGNLISEDELSEIMLSLMRDGAHNINLVTPTHYAPSIIRAVSAAKSRGLCLPIVYNTGSFETPETIRMLDGTVDIYLPDLKYYLPKTARKYSNAEAYPIAARAAIAEMVKQVGSPIFDGELMRRGVIVRILLLPGHLAEAKLSVKYLHEAYGDSIYISLMSQYTPLGNLPAPLSRRVSRAEYRELVDYAAALGVTLAYIQDSESADESYIPEFNSAAK